MTVTTTAAAPAMDLSGWWSRVGAHLVDQLALLALAVVAGLVVTGASGGGDAGWAVGLIVYLIGSPVYYTVGHGSRSGQTWGKRMCGIAVRDAADSGRVGYGQAFWRWLSMLILGLIPLAGILNYLAPLWTRDNQAWHDKMARTIVVYTSAGYREGVYRPR